MPQDKPAIGHLGDRMQGYVDEARKDLAARLNVSTEKIELVEANYVTWRDSSLGCPQPGMSYMQKLVNGMQIKLRSSGKIYHYHGGGNRQPGLCIRPAPNEPLPDGSGDA